MVTTRAACQAKKNVNKREIDDTSLKLPVVTCSSVLDNAPPDADPTIPFPVPFPSKMWVKTSINNDDANKDEVVKDLFSFEHVYKGFRGDDSYDPNDLSDVSIPSNKEGREQLKREFGPAAICDHNQRNFHHCFELEGDEYRGFLWKVAMEDRIWRMKQDRLGIIESREYEDSLTEAQKKDLIDHHNWFQLLTENEKLTLNYNDEKQKQM
jgi:hypothetical protein